MKLAFISTVFGYPLGGADTLWIHAAEAAVSRGDRLLLLLPATTADHARVEMLVKAGAELLVRRDPAVPRPLFERLRNRIIHRATPEVQALATFAPDLVIISGGGTYDLAAETALGAWIKASRTRYRLIANFQVENPTLDEPGRTRAGEALESAERVFFVSQRNLASTRRHLGAALPRAVVVQNPLRAVPPGPIPWPESPPWRLAALARLEGVKGLPLLLHALAASLGPEQDWTLSIFGRGPQHAELTAAATRLGLADRVSLRGFDPDLQRIWTEHHLLVSSALEEGVPMTIPEAMLHGRPVLATRVGGAEDWIADNVDGYLCPAPTVDLLATTLAKAWADRENWPAKASAAYASARARYVDTDHLQLIT